MKRLNLLTQQAVEVYVESQVAAKSDVFDRLGLTDAVLLESHISQPTIDNCKFLTCMVQRSLKVIGSRITSHIGKHGRFEKTKFTAGVHCGPVDWIDK